MNQMGAGDDLGARRQAAEEIIGGRAQAGVAEGRPGQVRARPQGRQQVLLGLIGVVQHPALASPMRIKSDSAILADA